MTATNADYLSGRVKFPPWLNALQQKPFNFVSSLSVATGTSGLLSVQIQADSYFMVEGLSITPSVIGAYELQTVTISDTTLSQPWSNAPVPLRDIAGRGDNMKWLSAPNLLRPSSVLNLNITNSQGSTQQMYVSIRGRKIYGLSDDQIAFLTRRMWFQYILPLPAIDAGQTSQYGNVNIYNESDFLCQLLSASTVHQFVVNSATAGAVSSEIMMQLRDQTSDNSFFSQKSPVRLEAGSMWTPYKSGGASFTNGQATRLQRPLLIRRNGQVQGEFDNLSATALPANTASLVMEGIRVFDAV